MNVAGATHRLESGWYLRVWGSRPPSSATLLCENKMAKFNVILPIAGSIVVNVDAEDEDEAIELAMQQASFSVECGSGTDCEELEVFETLVPHGNKCYAPISEASAHRKSKR
jgi:hypothetical protein